MSSEDTAAESSLGNSNPQEVGHIPPELIEYVPEEKREEFVRRIIHYTEQYSGPIAPDRIAAGWEKILPGSADRILVMSEVQQRHRIEMDKEHQRIAAEVDKSIIIAFTERERLAMWFGFISVLALVGLSFHAMSLGYTLESVATVAGTLAVVASAYIYSRLSNRKEQKEREALQKPSAPPELPDSETESEN